MRLIWVFNYLIIIINQAFLVFNFIASLIKVVILINLLFINLCTQQNISIHFLFLDFFNLFSQLFLHFSIENGNLSLVNHITLNWEILFNLIEFNILNIRFQDAIWLFVHSWTKLFLNAFNLLFNIFKVLIKRTIWNFLIFTQHFFRLAFAIAYHFKNWFDD